MKLDVLIIGYGVVGKHLEKEIQNEKLNISIYDPLLFDKTRDNKYLVNKEQCFDIAFVCVPTEMKDSGECDTSIVKNVIEKFSENVVSFCIKSTVPPETTEKIKGMLNVNNIVFSPEFYGNSIHAEHHKLNYVILGGSHSSRKSIAKLYTLIKHPDFRIVYTDSTTAEICKYMDNCWLGLKVTFVNEFRQFAEKYRVDYTELRELWLMDPRINRSHTFCYSDQPYYDSHCLNKDIPAFVFEQKEWGMRETLMDHVEKMNKRNKEKGK